ncbi:hypothetical protein [Pedobacter terrae]|uniref:hypothetical protein n=1 Tax=Pedobacter terrae TaxID=405671 RepID=UPI002FF672E7
MQVLFGQLADLVVFEVIQRNISLVVDVFKSGDLATNMVILIAVGKALIKDFKAKKANAEQQSTPGDPPASAAIDPTTGEVFPADSPYNQPEIISALSFAINQLETLPKKATRV